MLNIFNLQCTKWFPVFCVLSQGEVRTITEIAEEIGHSHPSVSKISREMIKQGLVVETRDAQDKRRNLISLSAQGQTVAQAIISQYTDVEQVVTSLLDQTRHNLWQAMAEWEFLLEQKSFAQRVREQRKRRESDKVEIVPYQSVYQAVFKQLNEVWISAHFTLEDADRRALEHPQSYILDKGGHILIALYENEPVGTCALIAMDSDRYDFELAKMAVAPHAQGKNIGWLLGQSAIDRAQAAGATHLYLESNTVLKPAINLYHKLGFQKISGYPTPYQRCNIQMELIL